MPEEITIEALQAEIEENKTLIAEQAAKIAEQEEVISELNKEVDALSKKKTESNIVVEHGGKSFEIVIPRFSHNGEIITATDLENNAELIAQLIGQESGVLKAID
jgi:hypothetical protein